MMILWTTQMFMFTGGPPIMWSSSSTDTLRGGLLRCFHARNIGSVGQRAPKLLAFKVGGLTKKSAARPRP